MAVTEPGSEVEPASPADQPVQEQHNVPIMMVGALGVVFGDIGTSPIYAFREALHASGEQAMRMDVLGVLSLIVWALTIIVMIKYVVFVLRADNAGEGGTLSLMALARSAYPKGGRIILGLGICGAALFFGDSIIAPAVSVLSAVEGLELVTPAFTPYVVPITLVILFALFSVQRFGSGRMAIVFGPIMAIWFLCLGAVGLWHIFDDPSVLLAVNPYYAVYYLLNTPSGALITVGAVFLAVTGAEALYVDLGHFGRRPIILAWLLIVFPSLLLCYFGQGAFVLSHGGRPTNPFFQMMPQWGLAPMVILATMATVIASQAVISGAFSLARQAVRLNILPRLEVRHTSAAQSGQIYMPRVNLLLAIGVTILVLGFGSSSALASAYGISVTGEMLMTTILLFVVMRWRWTWSLGGAIALAFFFGIIDTGFFIANIVKFWDGGWVSVSIALVMAFIMWTWVRGSRFLFEKTRKSEVPLEFLVGNLQKKQPQLVPGTAFFLTSDPSSAPTALMHSLKHYKVLHEKNIILCVVTAQQPKVDEGERVKLEPLNDLFSRMTLTFGYMEQPNIPRALAACCKPGWKFDIMTSSFFLSRRSLKASASAGIPVWQDRIFIGLARSAADATEYFQIPTGRVVEIGTQVAI
ncbi:potassium transporter Kup [Aquamicrobium segne]|uniref:Probable potassium transport system protein Kup n=1 Tax=Aquamicrobium segne TaxID=469547 RepID=A0ABW0H2R6_9HYPH